MFRNEKKKRCFGITVVTVWYLTFGGMAQGVWIERLKLTASDSGYGDTFGEAVSISGNYAVIGAPYKDESGESAGAAYIFKRNESDPNWTEQLKLIASDGAAEDFFGISVSISGSYAIVGAYLDDARGTNSGSAYIFRRNGTSWVEQQKLLASDGATGDLFGGSVSITSAIAGAGSGDLAIVGAYRDDNYTGSAYVFQAVECASWLTADLNSDCFVDFYDFGIFAKQWLKCGDPCDPNCQP